ncbi:extensin-like domain-containing protein [Roseobacter sinensis]|uniref:Extensin family protein n=1 Tax=Roseobacter sinensis TaxID=2931391 RepID=A0ABT3BBT8_9RHOB|nr:extensin family protein [Roseobacter sp. WL0113]MCV3270629.1 extensin family protein [Roseobacter sp. WL0113]
MTRRVLSALLLLLAGTVAAEVPQSSKRPVDRPAALTLEGSGAISTAAPRAATLRGTAPAVSLRPRMRTREVRRLIRRHQKLRAAGAICGDPAIQGEVVGAVPGRIAGCGVAQAVRVRAVSDIALSQRAVMDCGTAQALKTWVDGSVKPTLRKMGGGVASLKVAAHYVCRTRNHKAGARISEHGKGRAIDISGFVLRDGSTISVLTGWTARDTSRALRRMHRDACGPFGTVLGPDADSFHRDHFHFDTARYRNGTYCR